MYDYEIPLVDVQFFREVSQWIILMCCCTMNTITQERLISGERGTTVNGFTKDVCARYEKSRQVSRPSKPFFEQKVTALSCIALLLYQLR